MKSLLFALGFSCLAYSFLGIALPRPLFADPNETDFEAPLSVQSDPVNRRLRSVADHLYRKAHKESLAYRKSLDKGKLAAIKPAPIGKTYTTATQLDRIATQLIDRGETAGIDYHLRALEIQREIRTLVREYRKLPNTARRLSLSLKSARSESQKRTKLLPRLEKLTHDGAWETAAEEIHQIVDFLTMRAIWYDTKPAKSILGPFRPPQSLIDGKLREKRLAEQQEAWAILRQEAAPRPAKMIAELESLMSGKGSSDLPPGPEGLKLLFSRCSTLHLKTLRCRAIDWARGEREKMRPPSELDEMVAQWNKTHRLIRPATIEWIRADAHNAKSDEVRDKYLGYLKVLSELVALLGDDAIVEDLAEALEQLLDKSPEFSEEVAAYRVATAELLRWERRTAAAHARSHAERYLPLEEVCLEAARAKKGSPGLVSRRARRIEQAELRGTVPQVMPALTGDLLGKQIQLHGLVGLPTGKPMVASRYHHRIYGTFFLPVQVADAVNVLQTKLLVYEGLPPLTLEASLALDRAWRGDFQSAGCEIERLKIEPLIYRFIGLKESAQRIVPIGPLPPETLGNEPVKQVLLRLSLRPDWLLHEYFFVDLSNQVTEN